MKTRMNVFEVIDSLEREETDRFGDKLDDMFGDKLEMIRGLRKFIQSLIRENDELREMIKKLSGISTQNSL